MASIKKIEYRVKPVTRYVITRFSEMLDGEAGVETRGEYDSQVVAFEVAHALCKAEHDRFGGEIGDERFQYPSTQYFTEAKFEDDFTGRPTNVSGFNG